MATISPFFILLLIYIFYFYSQIMAKAQEEPGLLTNCIICDQEGKKSNPFVKNPTLDGLKTILNAAQLKDDDVLRKLSPHKDDILAGRLKVSFHTSCKKLYNRQVKSVQSEAESKTDKQSSVSQARLTRKDTSTFIIQRDCFICGRNTQRPEHLTAICTGTGKSTRDKVLHCSL